MSERYVQVRDGTVIGDNITARSILKKHGPAADFEKLGYRPIIQPPIDPTTQRYKDALPVLTREGWTREVEDIPQEELDRRDAEEQKRSERKTDDALARAYLDLDQPTNAQTVAALKVLIRMKVGG